MPTVNTLQAFSALAIQRHNSKRRAANDIEPHRHAYSQSDPNLQTYGVLVSNAGVAEVNGQYVFDTDHYDKAPYLMVLLADYPDVGTTSWVIHDGSNYYYVADQVDNPWQADWRVDTDGIAPTPTFELVAVRL